MNIQVMRDENDYGSLTSQKRPKSVEYTHKHTLVIMHNNNNNNENDSIVNSSKGNANDGHNGNNKVAVKPSTISLGYENG